MNILDKQDRSKTPIFNGSGTTILKPKRDRWLWAKPGKPGIFLLIPKDQLNIEGEYQREQVSDAKVTDIARNWDWRLFGTISVVVRKDGSFWVFEGGHRTRAAFKRDDVNELPCMVFESESVSDEARAFVGANTMKSAVRAHQKHKAACVAGEPVAVATAKILEKYGYKASSAATSKYIFAAVECLTNAVRENPERAERVFGSLASIAIDGEPISRDVFQGVYEVVKATRETVDILSGRHLVRLKEIGLCGINKLIQREKTILDRGGPAVCRKAVLDLLNKGLSRKITTL
jgi:hypothetical protein